MPRFEPDFTEVYASTPIWKKGNYELEIKNVRGQAWDQMRDDQPTGVVVRVVKLRPIIKGYYDSKGDLQTKLDGADIEDQPAEEIALWIHSKGAMAMSKRTMMAIVGFDEDDEDEFNEWLRSGVDLGFDYEPSEEGDGYDVTIGEGWKELEGKLVGAHMEKDTYQPHGGGEPVETQDYRRFFPAGALAKAAAGK